MIQIVGPKLNQWDVGRSVSVTASEATHVHFANQGDSKAVIMEIVEGKAKIPDYLLHSGKTLLAYAVLDRVTLEAESFGVKKRERPENYVYEDDQRNYIYELIANAERAADDANAVAEELRAAKEGGEFKGDPGPKGDPGEVEFLVVKELPTQNIKNAIYLLPVAESAEGNLFDEYIFANGAWEKIGSTSVEVNLDEYVKKTDYATSVKPGIVMIPSSNGYFGLSLITDQSRYPGGVKIQMATHAEIDARSQVSKPVVPSNLDYAIRKGLAYNGEEWTEEEKASAREVLGVTEQIGDIETALDSIIEIQTSLIGGDGA